MSLLGSFRRAGASAAASVAVTGAPARSFSLFRSSQVLQRSTFVPPLARGNWRVAPTRVKQRTRIVRGVLDENDRFLVPEQPGSPEERAIQAAIAARAAANPPAPRTKYPLRKQFMRKQFRTLFDRAQLITVIHAIDSTSFNELKAELADHFYSAHLCTGLVHIEDKPYAELKTLLRSTSYVLLQDDADKAINSLKALKRALPKYPNLLFLGGSIQGATASSFALEDLTSFESISHVKGSIIPYLNAPAQVIPVLQSPTVQLVALLQHHAKQLGGGDALAGDAAAAPA